MLRYPSERCAVVDSDVLSSRRTRPVCIIGCNGKIDRLAALVPWSTIFSDPGSHIIFRTFLFLTRILWGSYQHVLIDISNLSVQTMLSKELLKQQRIEYWFTYCGGYICLRNEFFFIWNFSGSHSFFHYCGSDGSLILWGIRLIIWSIVSFGMLSTRNPAMKQSFPWYTELPAS